MKDMNDASLFKLESSLRMLRDQLGPYHPAHPSTEMIREAIDKIEAEIKRREAKVINDGAAEILKTMHPRESKTVAINGEDGYVLRRNDGEIVQQGESKGELERQSRIRQYEREHVKALHELNVAQKAVDTYTTGIGVGLIGLSAGASFIVFGIVLAFLTNGAIETAMMTGLGITLAVASGWMLKDFVYKHRIKTAQTNRMDSFHSYTTEVGYISPQENLVIRQQEYADALRRLTEATGT